MFLWGGAVWETPRVGKGEILHNKVAPRSWGFGNFGRWQPVVFWASVAVAVVRGKQGDKDSAGFIFLVGVGSVIKEHL